MVVGQIYNEMAGRGLANSMRQWSEDWAGRSHNFASLHWEKPLPADTALLLRRRLIAEGHHDLAARLLIALIED